VLCRRPTYRRSDVDIFWHRFCSKMCLLCAPACLTTHVLVVLCIYLFIYNEIVHEYTKEYKEKYKNTANKQRIELRHIQ